MKAITIKEPWASMIANGYKTMETRSWKTSYRGRIAIHAGIGKPDKTWMENVSEMMAMIDTTHPGYIVAYADLVDCIPITEELISELGHNERICGFYSVGRYAFVLDNIKQIKPIKAKGKLGIWNYETIERR